MPQPERKRRKAVDAKAACRFAVPPLASGDRLLFMPATGTVIEFIIGAAQEDDTLAKLMPVGHRPQKMTGSSEGRTVSDGD